MFCINRQGWFHFKIRVPKELVPVIGASMIQRSLRTRQRRRANKLALELRDRIVPQFQKLRIELLSGVSEDKLKRLAQEMLPLKSGVAAKLRGQMQLSDLIHKFVADKSKHVDAQTLQNMQHTYELALFIMGNSNVQNINRDVCRNFRDVLTLLPAHAFKRHKGKSLDHVLALCEPPMHTTTVNKNIRYLSTMLIWAEREGYLEINPAQGLSISQNRKPSSERKAYDHQSL
jgi:hypothetical protein